MQKPASVVRRNGVYSISTPHISSWYPLLIYSYSLVRLKGCLYEQSHFRPLTNCLRDRYTDGFAVAHYGHLHETSPSCMPARPSPQEQPSKYFLLVFALSNPDKIWQDVMSSNFILGSTGRHAGPDCKKACCCCSCRFLRRFCSSFRFWTAPDTATIEANATFAAFIVVCGLWLVELWRFDKDNEVSMQRDILDTRRNFRYPSNYIGWNPRY